ncbi:MAG TPA: hypothetical protein VIQ62_03845, partial [Burkholderiales bacterium]
MPATARFLSILAIILLVPHVWAAVSIERPVATYDRASIHTAGGVDKIRQSGSLAGVAGWVEYDVSIANDGWFELFVTGNGWETEFFVDPKGDDPS